LRERFEVQEVLYHQGKYLQIISQEENAMDLVNQPELSMANLGNGALEEKFQVELERVLKNIADPNSADGKREIQIRIVMTPNAKRSSCDIDISTACKLQPDVPFASQMYVGRVGARHAAWEHNPDQLRLPMEGDAISARARVIGGKG
jgi:hypothetical protein